jgi:hypothetical protein
MSAGPERVEEEIAGNTGATTLYAAASSADSARMSGYAIDREGERVVPATELTRGR